MNYLLELGLEEVPARFVPGFCAEISQKLESALLAQNLAFASLRVLATPRRVAVYITGLAAQQADCAQVFKGPPVELCWDAQKNPLPPFVGFLKKTNLTPDQITTITENGKAYVYAQKTEPGKPAAQLLPQLVAQVIQSLNLPIAMRWGRQAKSFIRPLHWIVSLLDNQVLDFELFGIKAGRASCGHRFLTQNTTPGLIASGQEITLAKADLADYIALMRQHCIIVDQDERAAQIKQALTQHIPEAELDADLLAEVNYLVEYPQALVGEFEAKYLEIPQQILIQCMQKHQKFFPIFSHGILTNRFVVIAESVTSQSQSNIIAGNQNVLRARLEDVAFFWREDKQIPLSANLEKLKKIVFQKNLGTLYDKTERIQKLAEHLVQALGYQAQQDLISRTALLCKTDLSSHMVFELPALQGTMGMLYAREQGEDAQVAQGIFDHYLPRFSGDLVPQTPVGIAVSLADKIDTVACCFFNGLIPTGSQDPWGIRRAFAGILQIILANQLNLNLHVVLDQAFALLSATKSPNQDKCREFLAQRIKNTFLETNLPHDIIEAVAPHNAEPFKAYQIAQFLMSYKAQQPAEFKLICETATRVKRLAAKADATTTAVNLALFQQAEEKAAYKILAQSQPKATDYAQFFVAFTALSIELTTYFEKVMVMHEDAAIKHNRLAFLIAAHQFFNQVADFEKVVI